MPVSIAGVIVTPGTITAVLDGTGSIAITLPATDDPGLSITGWAYTVTERVSGGGRPSYQLEVPYDSASIDLAEVDAAVNNPALPILRGMKGDKGDKGDAGTGAERDQVAALSSVSGALAVDYSTGNYYTVAMTEDVTGFDFSNLPAGGMGITMMILFT